MAVWDTPDHGGVGHPMPWRCGTPHAMAVWDTPCHGGVGHPMCARTLRLHAIQTLLGVTKGKQTCEGHAFELRTCS